MGNKRATLVLVLVMCCIVSAFSWYDTERDEEREQSKGAFILRGRKQVVKTEAGDMSIVRSGEYRSQLDDKPLHVGFITMEPNSLFIPQYLDNDLILFIHRGEAKVGLIQKDDLVEQRLSSGDLYRIPGGSPFYLVNRGESQKLHVICSIERSDNSGWGSIQSFFIGGGTYPTSVLAGFDPETLSTAFNVSVSELAPILTRQEQGPIVFLSNSHAPSRWTEFLEMEHHQRKRHLQRMINIYQMEVQEDEEKEDEVVISSIRKVLTSVFGTYPKVDHKKDSSDSYNIYKRKPNYKNNYGWSTALDHKDFKPLRESDIGVYLVNLTQGSMMAPHINPSATEYGIVLGGSGRIQVVYPNGTSAMNAKVKEGDVFWVPRYFPFCQIASRSSGSSFEFFGFTTSARRNRPQFLVGKNSVLRNMRGPEFAAGFGVSEKRFKRIVKSQSESTILPPNDAVDEWKRA